MNATLEQFGLAEAVRIAPLIPLLPLTAAVVIGLLGPRLLRGASHWPAILGVAGALGATLIVAAGILGAPDPAVFSRTWQLYSWIVPAEGLSFNVSFRIDPLTAVMLAAVCGIALTIVAYSRDYMRDHGRPARGYERFFAFLCLFVFSMCLLVLSGNFLLLYLGWEAVGLCSYLLIGFYYDRPSAAAAATKAFLVNRVGDFGFGLGILLIYLWVAPLAPGARDVLDYAVVFENIGRLEPWQTTTIALLLFCGAAGKSAQLPLHVWLPDAMEGPSPVSALIHAATMVTAGVYMVVRCGAVFAASPTAMNVVTAVGMATALFAATVAVAQYDMKRILAWSTISQLGLMFVAVGLGAADTAIYHLWTHAFFKALLFLGAGSVMHALGGVIDVRQLGGLRRIMPWTWGLFLTGALSLGGFPLLSGFYSKDEILHAAWDRHWGLGAAATLTAMLTAFYAFRMVFLAFHGRRRLPPELHPHESGPWMLLPMGVLALGAVFAGYLGVARDPHGFLGLVRPHDGFMQRFLLPVMAPFEGLHPHGMPVEKHEGGHLLMYVSAGLSMLSILAAFVLYRLRPWWAEAVRSSFAELHALLHRRYGIDELYERMLVRPLRRLAEGCRASDAGIDILVWLTASVPRGIGAVVRPFLDGSLQSYALTMTAGLVLLAAIVRLVG